MSPLIPALLMSTSTPWGASWSICSAACWYKLDQYCDYCNSNIKPTYLNRSLVSSVQFDCKYFLVINESCQSFGTIRITSASENNVTSSWNLFNKFKAKSARGTSNDISELIFHCDWFSYKRKIQKDIGYLYSPKLHAAGAPKIINSAYVMQHNLKLQHSVIKKKRYSIIFDTFYVNQRLFHQILYFNRRFVTGKHLF